MKSNVKDDVCYAQPKNLEQRVFIANDFIKRYKYPVPFGIDEMSNAAEGAYAAWPERLSWEAPRTRSAAEVEFYGRRRSDLLRIQSVRRLTMGRSSTKCEFADDD